MDHSLIYTIIGSVVTAFLFGAIALRLKLPAIFGYLLAGVAIGPYTPGFVADLSLAQQLAEIGIILLMFGVGLHFSFHDLLEVRKIALPGAIVQMVSATLVGAVAAVGLGFELIEGLIFGFSLSVASTIVLLRSLEQYRLVDSEGGKIAIGWLIVEDLVMVLALVMLPVMAQMLNSEVPASIGMIVKTIVVVFLKVGVFFAFMMIVGRRMLPQMLVQVGKMRSSELMTLATLAIALGFAAMAYIVFHASFALGAFLAGMVLNESEIGRKAAKTTLPMRDVFSVLFFVSVGMLFEPMTVLEQPLGVLASVLVIVGAKGAAAWLILRIFRQGAAVYTPVAAGLAQIGEFSFILGSLALSMGLIHQPIYNLILAGAMISIVINPFLFRLMMLRTHQPIPMSTAS